MRGIVIPILAILTFSAFWFATFSALWFAISAVMDRTGGKSTKRQSYNPSFSADEIYFRENKLPEKGEDFPLPPAVREAMLLYGRKPVWMHYFMAWDALRHGLPEQELLRQLRQTDEDIRAEAVEWRRKADERDRRP